MENDQFDFDQTSTFGASDVNEYVDTTVDMSAGLQDAIYSSVDTSSSVDIDTTVDMSSAIDMTSSVGNDVANMSLDSKSDFAFHNASFNPYEGLMENAQLANKDVDEGLTANVNAWVQNPGYVPAQVNAAYGQAQNGYGQPYSYGQAQTNGAYGQQMNGAYGQAQMNGAYGQNFAYGQPQANGAYGQNYAYGQAQTNGTYGQNYAYGQANATYGQSQGGYGANQNAYTPPYTPPYNSASNTYGTPGKTVDTGVLVACIVGGVVLLIVIIACIAVKLTSTNVSKKDFDDTYGGRDWYSDEWDDYDFDDYDDYVYEEDGYSSVYDSIDWDDKGWKSDIANYQPEETWDDTHQFYPNLKVCIDDSLSYSFTREYYEELDKQKGVCIRVSYYQIEGDGVLNKDAINDALYETAMKSANEVWDNMDEYDYIFESYGYGYTVYVDSYITYCDESMFSMVSQIRTRSMAFTELYLNCLNVNLDLGMVMDNCEIIEPSSEFNETYSEALAIQDLSKYEMTDDELKALMQDEDALILYFTPCGLEFGGNFHDGTSVGWFSATVTDYEEFYKSN